MDVTVIIPTRNRLARLRMTLGSLATQALGGIEAEIVVVDNASEDGTVTWVRELAATFPYSLTVVTEQAPGVSAARNRAVERACGRLILSINDDTAPVAPDLVAGHVQAHAAHPHAIAILGRITYPSDQIARDPFLAWLNDDAQFAFGRLERRELPTPNHYYTAHLSFGRDVFYAVGRMDERLVFGFEDAEFGTRMMRASVPLVYRSDLVLKHDHPVSVAQWRHRAERMGTAGAEVNRLHPMQPAIAQPAVGGYWRTLDIADMWLSKFPTNWQWLHPTLRDAIYTIINQGSYARGYRRESRKVT